MHFGQSGKSSIKVSTASSFILHSSLDGNNFAPDTFVIVGGVIIKEAQIINTQSISFITPALPSGRTTVTVQNRGGLAQASLLVTPVSLSELPPRFITTLAGGSAFAGDGSLAKSASVYAPPKSAHPAAAAAQIILDPSNPTAIEITVNEGNTLQLKPRVLDSTGNVIDNAPPAFNSLSSDIDARNLPCTKQIDYSRTVQSFGGSMSFSRKRITLIVLSCILGIFVSSYSQVQQRIVALNAAAAAAQIIIDPSNPNATEITVNEGNTLQLKPRVLDSAGNVIDNAPLSYSSLSPDTATVDASGNIQGKAAGFSTLAVASGNVVATVTITVVKITAGATGFEITGVAQDLARRLYLADTRDHTILLAEDLEKTPNIYAGVNQTSGLVNDERLKSMFKSPAFLAFNQAEGTLYVSDSANHVIRLVRPGPSGKVETLAGTGQTGSADGSANQAMFNNPQGIALDNRGNLWVVDSGNHTIRRINLVTKKVETIAGKAGSPGFSDASGASARFNLPAGVALESESLSQQLAREELGLPPPPVSAIVADTGNGVIRRVKETGQVETIGITTLGGLTIRAAHKPPLQENHASVALSLSHSPALPLSSFHAPSMVVTFNSPTGVILDSFGNIYVSEPSSGQVKTLLPNGQIVPSAQPNTFRAPRGIAISQSGRVLVADSGRSGQQITYGEPALTSITPNQVNSRGGEKVTLKGKNFAPGTLVIAAGVVIPEVRIIDTQTISFNAPMLPSGLTTLTVQNRGGLAQKPLLVNAVSLNELPQGYVTTVAGGSTFSGDGSAATATQIFPVGITVDAGGNLLLVDSLKNGVRKITPASGIITTVAGNGNSDSSGDSGLAIIAGLSPPGPSSSNFLVGLASDTAGNFFVTDGGRIRKVYAATGIITTVAGGNYGFCGDGADALRACFNNPNGIAVDGNGNLFIADTFNHRIRKVIAATSIISTVAGSGPAGEGMGGFSGDSGPATSATLNNPIGVTVDSAGNAFIADAGNRRIRKVSAGTGIITTVAGNGTFASGNLGDNGPATAAEIVPLGIALDAAGNLIIADTGSVRVRKVDAATQIITTIAGTGESGYSGDGGPATAASLRAPNAVAVDAAGNILITDSLNYRLRKVDAKTGIISTVGGNGLARVPDENGPATASALTYPGGIVFDAAGNLFIADTGNSRIRRVDAATGIITTVAGNNLLSFSGDGGPASAADLSAPNGIAIDGAGNLFVADTSNQRIRKIDTKGIITTVAGNSQPSFQAGFSGDGDQATKALLNYPRGVAIDGAGNLFIADTGNHRIRRVDAKTGIITTAAGSGDIGSAGGGFSGDNGPGTSALLKFPYAVAVDRAGNVLIADGENFRIRRLDTKGILTTVIGTGQQGYCDANQLASAISLGSPAAIALDSAGNIFVSEPNSHRILKIDSKGTVTTVAGNCNQGFSGDSGPATFATFNYPIGIAFDPAGNLCVADTNNHRIRAVHASGRTGRRQP